MSDITAFFLNNIWVCLGVGVLVVVIVDEILGVSRALLADPTDTPPYAKNIREAESHREQAPQPEYVDEAQEQFGNAEDGPSVEDMLRPK